jgi:hypothetical protein
VTRKFVFVSGLGGMRESKIIQVIKTNWQIFWLLFVITLTPVLFNQGLQKWWRFRQVERQFRGEMDPSTVQEWAANVLAQNPWSNHVGQVPGWYGTNLPPGASNLVEKYFYRPRVEIYFDHVVVFGGGRGRPELWVGYTNFIYESDRAKMWKPGVYIVIPEERE